ncbi:MULTISPECIES: CVNH domain-containing protein [unclassified Nostoc]|uniref:CVNH domain-containing protein n=1 Tax=unclassified Nostoc TaxID=2593658 RepID=UPI002AD216E5|nr:MULTISPECIES: CVNH domain-containing protein [unclassified Nostoc]MDZ8120918.1 CVNH domain-containing protein [Nostoc sp. CmiVER01]MDZ8226276.1 CVNH domain-containing protein [Nostoc sp. ChiVER01]
MITTNKTTALEQLPSEPLKDSVARQGLAKSQRSIHIQRYSTMLRNLKTPLKSIGVLSFVLLAAPFIKPDAALAGGFSRSCVNRQVSIAPDGAYLNALCTRANGSKVQSRLRISDYIANYGGRLEWALGGGGFHVSCRSVKYPQFGGQLMVASCGDGRGGWVGTGLNLDDKISNQNGVLAIDR